MTTSITELEARVTALRAKAAKPASDLDQATAELEAARQAEADRQAARRDDWDRQLLATWQDEDDRIRAEETQARTDFLAAIAADPVWSAWIRVRSSWSRRNALRSTAEAARYRHAPQDGEIPQLHYRDPSRLWDEITEAIRDVEQQAGAEETERLQTTRDAYAEETD